MIKKLLAAALAAAVVLYFGYRLTTVPVQAETQPEPEENTTEIYGRIKEANGNEIVLAIGTMPLAGSGAAGSFGEGATGRGGERGAGGGDAAQGGFPSQGEGATGRGGERAEVSGDAAQGGERGAGGGDAAQGGFPSQGEGATGRGQGARGGQAGQAGQGGFAMGGSIGANLSSLVLTGEEKTFLIPVTAKITTGSGENERTVRFTQLAYKNVVRLTLNESGAIVAVNVIS